MIRRRTVDAIQSRQDLADFVRLLAADLDQNRRSWENDDLKSFLETMAAWIDDLDGYYRNAGEPLPEAPTWCLFGQILAAASVYE
jgi:hypothetical protein